jgi:hypothetical protein
MVIDGGSFIYLRYREVTNRCDVLLTIFRNKEVFCDIRIFKLKFFELLISKWLIIASFP